MTTVKYETIHIYQNINNFKDFTIICIRQRIKIIRQD